MGRRPRSLAEKRLDEAHGYLLLGLPRHALEALQQFTQPHGRAFKADAVFGRVYLSVGRITEAVTYLERAQRFRPGDPHVAIGLAWCYKRTHRLAEAIHVLDLARRSTQARRRNGHVWRIVEYNLACYWCLAGDQRAALRHLLTAIRGDWALRRMALVDPDFVTLRAHSTFERAISRQGEPV